MHDIPLPGLTDPDATESGTGTDPGATESGSAGRSRGPRRSGSRRRKRFGSDRPSTPEDPPLDRVVDPESMARTILLNKLTGQPRTRAELADTLAERGIPDEVAARVLDRFGEVGLIDDAVFASAWVESRHHGRGLAKRALAQELRHRGVDDELARDALETLDSEREMATARSLVQRKMSSVRSLDRQVAMRRLLGMLARKGYPAGLSMTVVREALDATEEELPPVDDTTPDEPPPTNRSRRNRESD